VTSVQIRDERRKAVAPPEHLTAEMSLFDYLSNCRPPLDAKLIDIAIAQTQTPHALRDDAAQDIRIMWSAYKPDTKRFKPGQIASYAHYIAKQTCWRLRRLLGGPVCLPGSAFRKRKDGSSYVTPGLLSVPLDWHDLERWFNTAEGTEQAEYLREPEAFQPPDLDAIMECPVDAGEGADDTDEQLRDSRLQMLERHAKKLSLPTYNVLRQLVCGDSLDEIEKNTGIKRRVVIREIYLGASLIGADLIGGLPEAQAAV
jgi:hypothetical protein